MNQLVRSDKIKIERAHWIEESLHNRNVTRPHPVIVRLQNFRGQVLVLNTAGKLKEKREGNRVNSYQDPFISAQRKSVEFTQVCTQLCRKKLQSALCLTHLVYFQACFRGRKRIVISHSFYTRSIKAPELSPGTKFRRPRTGN